MSTSHDVLTMHLMRLLMFHPYIEGLSLECCLFYYFTKPSPATISFPPFFCELLLQSDHWSPLDVFKFFDEFLQTSFALPLLCFSCPRFWSIFVFRMFLPLLRVCPSFIVGVLRFVY